jgi:hypothetical protein
MGLFLLGITENFVINKSSAPNGNIVFRSHKSQQFCCKAELNSSGKYGYEISGQKLYSIEFFSPHCLEYTMLKPPESNSQLIYTPLQTADDDTAIDIGEVSNPGINLLQMTAGLCGCAFICPITKAVGGALTGFGLAMLSVPLFASGVALTAVGLGASMYVQSTGESDTSGPGTLNGLVAVLSFATALVASKSNT